MRVRGTILERLVLAALACWMAPLEAATFSVNTTADNGTGGCTALECTLREAIVAANATAAADTINFGIGSPATGELRIALASPLPTITQPVTIDGYSQPGSAVNTSANASDATLRIRVDGNFSRGLAVCADDVTIRGLAITGFAGAGIAFGETNGGATCAATPTGGRILGSFVGLRTNGSTVGSNANGIIVNNAVVDIGSEDDADRNVVSGNTERGIRVAGSASATSGIYNNLIGTGRLGSGSDRGNGASGIELSAGATAVEIGSNTARNLIAFNGTGLLVSNTASSNHRFFANEFRRNDGLGIDLFPIGATPNDVNDVDTGVNGLQNAPEVLSGARTETGATANLRLDVGHAGELVYRIALYASPVCDASGFGEGEFLLAQQLRTISASSETFTLNSISMPPMPPGTVFTATATDPDGNTSEFSECFELDPPVLVVNNTLDVGDGVCDPVACTLREAIFAANARSEGSSSTISFAIPGEGPHLIAPLTPLPTIARTMIIDGYTQPGASPNTLDSGSDADLRIEVADLDLPLIAGFDICAPDVTLRGLAIAGFQTNVRALSVGCDTSPLRLTLEGNFIGLRADGSVSDLIVGAGDDNVRVGAAATGTRIGGTLAAQRNVIGSASLGAGIEVTGAAVSDVQILGNYIGTDPSGLEARSNGSDGVVVSAGAQRIVIGGVEAGAANRIAFNQGDGIRISDTATQRVTAFANDIFDNEDGFAGFDLGIRLGFGGADNDPEDADAGANGGQNWPEIDSASNGASGLVVLGSLDVPAATSNATYTIAMYESSNCDASGSGEGELFLGAETVALSGDSESFEFTLAVSPEFQGAVLTATATDPLGNTSEFSPCLVAPLGPVIFTDGFEG
jgi:CSLREA domain-containing protein